jgi:dephospho-CoA kinase
MLKIGITGGIGSGKSYVCEILEKMGYPVFYSDLEAKRLMIQKSELIEQIKLIVGENAYQQGELNKPIIRNFLFENEQNKEKLNNIIHPFVYQEFENWCVKQKEQIVFNESALLIETGSYNRFDKTILITAPEAIKIERITKRDRLDFDEIKKRFGAQLNDETKIEKADFIIKNDEEELIIPQINNILRNLN